MARRVTWSKRAQNDRYSIFKYWNKRNKSKTYSKKLNKLFIASIEFVALHPHTGKLADRNGIRIKFASHYAIIYEFNEDELFVLAIFDTRQSPDKLERIIT